MQTTAETRVRYRKAFARYAKEQTRLRNLRRELTPGGDSPGIHSINAQSEVVSGAEHDYRVVRLEYIDRLLRPRLS
jgi:hypothetical protein